MASQNGAWQDLKNKEGEALKIYGGQKVGEDEVDESEVTDSSQGQDGGFANLMSQIPQENDQNNEVARRINEPLTFQFYDFNLKAGAKYEYRVKAVGTELKTNEEVEGDWSETLMAMTKEDKGISFDKYVPGLRDKKGKLVEKDGKIISPDKVYVMISKQFTPPWSPKKYFINYSLRSVIPSKIGRVVKNYRIKTEEGQTVYKDYKQNFMYVGGGKPSGGEYSPTDIKNRDKKWKEYKISRDFNTDWFADKVDEVVEVQNIVQQVPGPDGELIQKTVEKKKYRYFLVVTDQKTKTKEKFELKRTSYDKSLLKHR
jgi:hypothetical protein